MLPPPRWDLVTESFSEAAFLWARWDDALDSPQHTLDGVVRSVERRLIGALDGVRIGGARAAETLLVPALTGRRRSEATVAAHLLAMLSREQIAHIIAALTSADAQRLADIRRGLECCASAWPRVLVYSLPGLRPEAQAAMLEAFAFRRFALPAGVDGGLAKESPWVQRASLRLATTVHQPWSLPYIEWGLPRSAPELHVEATRAGMLRAHPHATSRAQEVIAARSAGSDTLLPLFAIARGERLLPVVAARVEAGEALRELFDALACIGTVAAADTCAAALGHAEQTRLAADALAAITGLDPRPPPGEIRSDEPPRDQLLLPSPSVDTMRASWADLRRHYDPRQRYLGGRPFSAASLHEALHTQTMRRRNLLASELMMHTRGTSYIATQTWTDFQRAQLASLG